MAKKSKPYGGGDWGITTVFVSEKSAIFFGQIGTMTFSVSKCPASIRQRPRDFASSRLMLYVGGDKGIGTGVNGGHDEILSRAAAKGDL